MTEEKELRISYDEVTKMSLECKCGAEVTFDLNQDKYKDPKWDWPGRGLKCSVCGNTFDSRTKSGLLAFCQWLTEVETSQEKVFFRIRLGAISDSN